MKTKIIAMAGVVTCSFLSLTACDAGSAAKKQSPPSAKAEDRSSPLRGSSLAEDAALAYVSLIYAAEHGDEDAVDAWIKRRVDVNGRGFDPDSGNLAQLGSMRTPPLVAAAAKGHLKIVESLFRAGADPNACCCSCIAALHEAIRNRHADVVKILLQRGANPHLLYDGTTSPLELARQSGDPTIQRYLEDHLTRSKQ